MNVLLKIQKKLDIFVSLLQEVENAKAEIENDYHEEALRNKSRIFDDIYSSFFRLCYFMTNSDCSHLKQIGFLRNKIVHELSTRCNHQFVEDDIECNMENIHISYCIICEIKK